MMRRLDHSRPMMRSRVTACAMPLLFVLTVISVAWGTARVIGHELAATLNTRIDVHTATANRASASTPARSLTVEVTAPTSEHCNRITAHLVYRCEGESHVRADGSHVCDGRPVYYPLTASISGAGFGLAARQVAQGRPYTAVLGLPAGMPPGEYQYVQRALYICSWWGGMIERRIPFETAPVSVLID